MSEELARELAALIEDVQDRDRPLPWVVHSGCSFRRIASEPTMENGGRSFPDGNVLHAYNQRSDNHPDLSMSEDQLNSLVRIINLVPDIIAALHPTAPDDAVEAVACSLWREEAVRAAPNIVKYRTIEAFRDQLPSERERWRQSAQAAIAALSASRDSVLEEAAKVCEAQQQVFLSEEYSIDQPFSSFHERFACGRCAEEIRSLKPQGKGEG